MRIFRKANPDNGVVPSHCFACSVARGVSNSGGTGVSVRHGDGTPTRITWTGEDGHVYEAVEDYAIGCDCDDPDAEIF